MNIEKKLATIDISKVEDWNEWVYKAIIDDNIFWSVFADHSWKKYIWDSPKFIDILNKFIELTTTSIEGNDFVIKASSPILKIEKSSSVLTKLVLDAKETHNGVRINLEHFDRPFRAIINEKSKKNQDVYLSQVEYLYIVGDTSRSSIENIKYLFNMFSTPFGNFPIENLFLGEFSFIDVFNTISDLRISVPDIKNIHINKFKNTENIIRSKIRVDEIHFKLSNLLEELKTNSIHLNNTRINTSYIDISGVTSIPENIKDFFLWSDTIVFYNSTGDAKLDLSFFKSITSPDRQAFEFKDINHKIEIFNFDLVTHSMSGRYLENLLKNIPNVNIEKFNNNKIKEILNNRTRYDNENIKKLISINKKEEVSKNEQSALPDLKISTPDVNRVIPEKVEKESTDEAKNIIVDRIQKNDEFLDKKEEVSKNEQSALPDLNLKISTPDVNRVIPEKVEKESTDEAKNIIVDQIQKNDEFLDKKEAVVSNVAFANEDVIKSVLFSIEKEIFKDKKEIEQYTHENDSYPETLIKMLQDEKIVEKIYKTETILKQFESNQILYNLLKNFQITNNDIKQVSNSFSTTTNNVSQTPDSILKEAVIVTNEHDKVNAVEAATYSQKKSDSKKNKVKKEDSSKVKPPAAIQQEDVRQNTNVNTEPQNNPEVNQKITKKLLTNDGFIVEMPLSSKTKDGYTHTELDLTDANWMTDWMAQEMQALEQTIDSSKKESVKSLSSNKQAQAQLNINPDRTSLKSPYNKNEVQKYNEDIEVTVSQKISQKITKEIIQNIKKDPSLQENNIVQKNLGIIETVVQKTVSKEIDKIQDTFVLTSNSKEEAPDIEYSTQKENIQPSNIKQPDTSSLNKNNPSNSITNEVTPERRKIMEPKAFPLIGEQGRS